MLVADAFRHHSTQFCLCSQHFFRRRIDPTQEIAKVRHSLTLLESYVLGGSSLASSLEVAAGQLDQLAHSITGTAPLPAPARVDEKAARAETPQPAEFSEKPGATGSLGRQTGGLYAGPTAAVTLFSSVSLPRDFYFVCAIS